MKIWTCGNSPPNGSPNARTQIKNVNGAKLLSKFWNFFRPDPNDFLSRLVTMEEISLYHYNPETKQQSMEWRHSGSPRLKKFQVQISAEKNLASFLWDQESILLAHYLPKGHIINVEYYSSLLVKLKDVLKKKPRGKLSKRPCSFKTIPLLTVHLQPKRTWPTCACSVLIIRSILRIWTHQSTTCSLH